ncbi:hypothetical protein UFOVP275_64 [uncultured Caudovirales phage]|uniref:Uncharacterized protein n=1 Tax=uncultured Caudovirales phage TaxID=2100421 RepID=A0A6J5LTP7_9CAUD|nr:hypothetical protein UFOVP275_64 [uncultured Caudovirales phage]
MTKRKAAIGLLRHGALKLDQFHEITGWQYWECRELLTSLLDEGVLVRPQRGVYQLAE